jgi:NAD(P)H dehydrogenase (quinone)
MAVMHTVGVTGATGTVGGAALTRLAEAMEPSGVVALARRPEAVTSGVGTRPCDYDDVASLRRALDGLDGLVFVSSDGDADIMLRHHLNVVAAARDAGIGHVVYLSSVGADLDSPFCYDRVNALTEQLLAEAVPDVVAVRAGLYTDFLHTLMGDGPDVRLPVHGEAVLAPVPRADVGRALADAALTAALTAALGEPASDAGRRSQVRHAVGPQDVTLDDIARSRGQRLETVTMDEYRTRLVAEGESPWWAFAYATLLEVVDAGRYASPAATRPGVTTSA